jgi:uncharacterized protein (DUF2126 family)
VTVTDEHARQMLVRRGFALEWALAVAVLPGLLLNAVAGWWWADPATGYVLVHYGACEATDIFTGQ